MPGCCWRYSPESRDADTSVSGAVMMGLMAARNAGIKVPDECIDKGLEYFRKMTSARGGVGYSGGVGGLGGSKNLQAIATLVYAVGRRKDVKEYNAVLKQTVGNLEHREGSYPFYFRYYMAQALFQGDFEFHMQVMALARKCSVWKGSQCHFHVSRQNARRLVSHMRES